MLFPYFRMPNYYKVIIEKTWKTLRFLKQSIYCSSSHTWTTSKALEAEAVRDFLKPQAMSHLEGATNDAKLTRKKIGNEGKWREQLETRKII